MFFSPSHKCFTFYGVTKELEPDILGSYQSLPPVEGEEGGGREKKRLV